MSDPTVTSTVTAADPSSPVRLVAVHGPASPFTETGLVDSTTALQRGLADYLLQLSVISGTKTLKLARVYHQRPAPEDEAKYPAVLITHDMPGSYDASKFVPGIRKGDALPTPGFYLSSSSERVLELKVELWATEPVQRRVLAKMLEDALNPVEWMYGFILELPFYYNARATYELKDAMYMEAEEDATRGFRILKFTVVASVPVLRVFQVAQGDAQLHLTVDPNAPGVSDGQSTGIG